MISWPVLLVQVFGVAASVGASLVALKVAHSASVERQVERERGQLARASMVVLTRRDGSPFEDVARDACGLFVHNLAPEPITGMIYEVQLDGDGDGDAWRWMDKPPEYLAAGTLVGLIGGQSIHRQGGPTALTAESCWPPKRLAVYWNDVDGVRWCRSVNAAMPTRITFKDTPAGRLEFGS